jgi:fructokinase
MKILSIGEVLWDVFDHDREFVGGAPLNVSVHVRRLGHSAALFSAVGNDRRGDQALERIKALGLSTDLIQRVPEQATGTAVVATDANANPVFTIARPAAFDFLNLSQETLSRLRDFDPDWIYFGTLAQTESRNEQTVHRIVECFPKAKRFYDINLRDGHWDLGLVERLSHLATALKMNLSEAEVLSRRALGDGPLRLDDFCDYWSSTFGSEIVCVTLGGKGCAIYSDGRLSTFDGFPVEVVDTVGSGDAFAAAILQGIAMQWPVEQSAAFANALGALVASRPGATPNWTLPECRRLIECSPGISKGPIQKTFQLEVEPRREQE